MPWKRLRQRLAPSLPASPRVELDHQPQWPRAASARTRADSCSLATRRRGRYFVEQLLPMYFDKTFLLGSIVAPRLDVNELNIWLYCEHCGEHELHYNVRQSSALRDHVIQFARTHLTTCRSHCESSSGSGVKQVDKLNIMLDTYRQTACIVDER